MRWSKMKRLVTGWTLLIVVDPSNCCHTNMYLHFFIRKCKKMKRKLGIHFKKQYYCAKAKNRDILESRLTSEKIRDNGLKKRSVAAKWGRQKPLNSLQGARII
jgi:hypothetical protein